MTNLERLRLIFVDRGGSILSLTERTDGKLPYEHELEASYGGLDLWLKKHVCDVPPLRKDGRPN
jgi:hypothetical protein